VEPVGDESIQFIHSVMQSYLASSWIREDVSRVEELLERIPSRELLTAIVMAGTWGAPGEADDAKRDRGRLVATFLSKAARKHQDRMGLPLATASIKIVTTCNLSGDLPDQLVAAVGERWEEADASSRLEAIEPLAALRHDDAYRHLRATFGATEFEVRLSAGQALGQGGDKAYRSVEGDINAAMKQYRETGADRDTQICSRSRRLRVRAPAAQE
jgi:hypothetical protein